MKTVLFFCVCYWTTAFVQAGPVQRLVLHDEQSVTDIIHDLEANVAALNASLKQALAIIAAQNASLNAAVTELRGAIQAERKERCQSGVATFHELHCSTCHHDVNIAFNPHFSKPPSVVYGMDKLDVDAAHNVRIDATVSHVTTSGATLTVATWGDTYLFPTQYSWMACPSS